MEQPRIDVDLKRDLPYSLSTHLEPCMSKVITISRPMLIINQQTPLEMMAGEAKRVLPEGAQIRAVVFLPIIELSVSAQIYYMVRPPL